MGMAEQSHVGMAKQSRMGKFPLQLIVQKSGHLYIKVALSICQLTHSLWDCRASEEVQVASDPMQQPFHQLQLWQIITNIICYTAFSAAFFSCNSISDSAKQLPACNCIYILIYILYNVFSHFFIHFFRPLFHPLFSSAFFSCKPTIVFPY